MVAKPARVHLLHGRREDEVDAGVGWHAPRRRPRRAGSAAKSSPGPNCVGLTKRDTTTTSASRAPCASATRWPSWSAPMVGTSPMRRSAWRALVQRGARPRGWCAASSQQGLHAAAAARSTIGSVGAGERAGTARSAPDRGAQRRQVRRDGGGVAAGHRAGRLHRRGRRRARCRAARRASGARTRRASATARSRQAAASSVTRKFEAEHAGDVGERPHRLGDRDGAQPERAGEVAPRTRPRHRRRRS